jgi:steroid 5-alpha reductase family enzyme
MNNKYESFFYGPKALKLSIEIFAVLAAIFAVAALTGENKQHDLLYGIGMAIYFSVTACGLPQFGKRFMIGIISCVFLFCLSFKFVWRTYHSLLPGGDAVEVLGAYGKYLAQTSSAMMVLLFILGVCGWVRYFRREKITT